MLNMTNYKILSIQVFTDSFNNALSIAYYRMTVTDELCRASKEVVMACFKIHSSTSGRTKENHKHISGQPNAET